MSYDDDHFDAPPLAYSQDCATTVEPDLPEDDYHAEPHLSSTLVRKLDSSVRDYLHRRLEDVDETDAMQLGSLVHRAVLEPGQFESEVIERPDPPVDPSSMSSTSMTICEALAADGDFDAEAVADDAGVQVSTVEKRATKDDHQALADYIDEYGPAPDPDHVDTAKRLRARVHQHPKIKGGLLDPSVGQAETSIFWQHPSAPVACRARPDYLRDWSGGKLVVDLKTTGRSLGWWKRRGIWQRKYHLQAAWYTDGVEEVTGDDVHAFVFVVAETSEPHRVGIFELDAQTLRRAQERCDAAVGRLVGYWQDPQQFTGPYREIETLSAPEWA